MPIDPRLHRSPFEQTLQQAVKNVCQMNHYPLIITPLTDVYQTTDGIHLTYAESVRFTNYLCAQVHKTKQPRQINENNASLASY